MNLCTDIRLSGRIVGGFTRARVRVGRRSRSGLAVKCWGADAVVQNSALRPPPPTPDAGLTTSDRSDNYDPCCSTVATLTRIPNVAVGPSSAHCSHAPRLRARGPSRRPQPRDTVGAEALRARRSRGRAGRTSQARARTLTRAARGARARPARSVGPRQHSRSRPQAAAAHDHRRRDDHLPAHRRRAVSRDPVALRRQRAAHHPTTEDPPRGHPHTIGSDRDHPPPCLAAHQRADRLPAQSRGRRAGIGGPFARRARAMDPLAHKIPYQTTWHTPASRPSARSRSASASQRHDL